MIPYYHTQSKCGKVRIIAAPFGYGPIVAAATLAKILNLTFDDWQINTPISKNFDFKLLLNFGVKRPINEPESAFRIWIDCLMWLRNKIPKEVEDYDLFLAEKFFKTNPELFSQIPESKIIDISPLYSLNGSPLYNKSVIVQNYGGNILVSFGGVETPFTTDVHRFTIPDIVLESLVITSRKLKDKRKIICCIPMHISKQLINNRNFSEILFLSPTHEEFISILKTASIYIVQPGLYGPFEAFENEIPTVFTTPFSYTQVCQARAFEKEDLMGYIPMWSELNEAIGSLQGDFFNEQEACFEKISFWIANNIIASNFCQYYKWAEMVLKSEIVSSEMTIKRKQYVKPLKSIKPIVFKKLLCKWNTKIA